MIFNVYKKKRRGKNGKMIPDRLYRGKYRLDGDYDVTDIPLKLPISKSLSKSSVKWSKRKSRSEQGYSLQS